jgi:hypothetical protein
MMAWLSALIAAIVAEVVGRFGGKIGKTEATDAKADKALLSRAGERVRDWVRSCHIGK